MSDKGGIIRINRRDVWFTADKRPFNNPSISWDTKGLLAYLLTKPDGWQIRFWHLVKQGNAQRYRMRRMLKELEAWGILVRRRVRNDKGQYDWVSDVYEDPVPVLRNKEQHAVANGDEQELEAIRRRLAYYGEDPSDDVISDGGRVEGDGAQAEKDEDNFADWFPEGEQDNTRDAPKTAQEVRQRTLAALAAFDNGVSAGIGSPRAPRHEEDATERIAQHIAGIIPTSLPTDEERWTRGWASPIGEMLACTQGEEDLVDLIDRVWEESTWLQENATTARYFVNAVLRLARQLAQQQDTDELVIEPDLAVIEENWV